MPYKKELETNFEVVKVLYEPHSESTWTLKHKDAGIFCLDEKIFETIQSDELLVGKIISGIVEISGNIVKYGSKKRDIQINGKWIDVISGQIKRIYDEDGYHEYFLDSLIPICLTVSLENSTSKNLSVGDWITVKYDGISGLILPRGKNLK